MNTNKSVSMSDESITFLENLTQKKMTLGNFLWSIRECEEMSQSSFASVLGVSRQYLCDIERGRRIVSPKSAADFATKLGYSAMQFVRLAVQDELDKYGLHYDIHLMNSKVA
jgi:transcriptional regulator with XRE-family HTH domain